MRPVTDSDYSTVLLQTTLRNRLKIVAMMHPEKLNLQKLLNRIIAEWLDKQQYEQQYLKAKKGGGK